MDVWGPACVSGQDCERYFVLVVDDYTRYTTVILLRSKVEVPDVLIPWIRAVRLQLCERFRADLLVMRLHSDRGGELSSDLLWDISPHWLSHGGRSYLHDPCSCSPFSVAVCGPPTLRWTRKVGDASVFRVWGSRAFVRNTSADKLSARAIPCVFLHFSQRKGVEFFQTFSPTPKKTNLRVLQRFVFRYSSPQSIPLPTGHLLSAPPSDEFVEPSGPYPKLVSCLMYLMTRTRPDLAYPLSILARYVAPGYTFSLGSGSISWRSTRSSFVLGSNCEAEIYAGAMAAQELRWLPYLHDDLGERPCSSPIVYINNKAMIALCKKHRLEHRTKHIALRYFLARDLQHRGQLRLAYVATRANIADIFTKALPLGDH
ncbi:unnamed protein product [Closterium sp. NIES-53]